ncbi:MAG TPA: glycosyltransferase [Rhizomicrobium sp.]|jgi:hopene-associated glycosyltransferase HpnB
MTFVALVPVAIWVFLLLGRGLFWCARERDEKGDGGTAAQESFPSVIAIVPARDEREVIARSLESLFAQDYRGPFRIVLVDDQSTDETAGIARDAAARAGKGTSFECIEARARPNGWAGKVWAMQEGLAHVCSQDAPDYLLLTDADIAHAPDNLRRLVARAEAGRLVLVSSMAKLHCESFAEKLLIPAFVFFFDMLFPFAWVNDPDRSTAAAAGGCMLARREALLAAGGFGSIAGAIIDDCALARALKRQGPIWLGLTNRATSIRPYGGFVDIARMVARSAFAQLGYSPALLCGTVLGMLMVYAAPPLLALFTTGTPRFEGVIAWVLMAVAFQPMLHFYRRSPLWGFALPLIGALYAAFTVDSAIQYWRGRGGMWKGRAQAMA